MADRYPLVYNPSANQLQELQSGDSLDVGNSSIKGATGYATTTGTSSQFLKADGSVDSNTYLTSSGTAALASGLTGSPSITVSNITVSNVSASSSVTAATFYGDGQNLINTGSTLSASSGIQRVVLTGQTSGTMTSSATDSDFTYDSSSNTLNVQNLNVQGTTTTIDTAVTEVDSLAIDGLLTTLGSVGIGTTSTALGKIQLKQSTTTHQSGFSVVNPADNSKLSFWGSGSEFNIDAIFTTTGSYKPLAFRTSNAERMRISPGGYVLIGGHSARTYDDTGDSNVILDVYGGSTSGKRGILSLSGRTNGNAGDLGTIWFNNNDNSGAGVGTQMKLSAAMQAKSVTSDSNADNDAGANLRFYTKPEGGNLAERLCITSDGQIGMGIVSPTQESGRGLHIRGADGGQTRIHLTNNATGDTATDGFYIISQGAESGGASGEVMLQQKENKALKFATNNTERLRITGGGHILPGGDNTQDLGSSAKRFANIYTGDLNLSNEGSANDVDGTWGQFTIQEGEDDLFLINRRTGKKYKFNLTEVD